MIKSKNNDFNREGSITNTKHFIISWFIYQKEVQNTDTFFFLIIIFCSYYSMLLEISLANYKADFTCRNKCIDKYRQLGTAVEYGGLSSGK